LFVNEKAISKEDLKILKELFSIEPCGCSGCQAMSNFRSSIESHVYVMKDSCCRINIRFVPYPIRKGDSNNPYKITFWDACPNNFGSIIKFENFFDKLSDEQKVATAFHLDIFT
jgi:hypothetical protein